MEISAHGCLVRYQRALVSDTADWHAFSLLDPEQKIVGRTRFSLRGNIANEMDRVFVGWLDGEWIRSRRAANRAELPPFFSDKNLSVANEPKSESESEPESRLGESRPKTRRPPRS